MANRLLTQEMMERETRQVLHDYFGVPWAVVKTASVVMTHRPGTDQEYVDVQLGNKHAEFDVSNADLMMSLDDFSDRMLRPVLAKLADHMGYASWD